jgi:hypothetical protein
MSSGSSMQPIRIPQEPCSWGAGIYMGKEVEFTPVGDYRLARSILARKLFLQLIGKIPHAPHAPHAAHAADVECDIFTPLGRFYVEMSEFIEVAGPTCQSAEAVAWAGEMAFECLQDVALPVNGKLVVLCHTPSDYGNYSSPDGGQAHSTGCHINLLCPRPLDPSELEGFAALVSPLNLVFGPGGLSWSDGRLRFSCDPRADHVKCLVGASAHGGAPKPFVMLRDEPFAQSPNQRLQFTAFGSPRSPVSAWLQAELLTQAFALMLDKQRPPWRVVEPIQALRAGPNDPIALTRPWPKRSRSIEKAELAVKTVKWLAERSAARLAGPSAAGRIALVRDLSIDAVTAACQSGSTPPLFPTDIVVKQALFDRVARMHKFNDLTHIAKHSATRHGQADTKTALDAIIITDVLFGTPARQQSTYELAHRCGLFVRPEFDYPVDLADLSQLPAGIAPRDATRARLIAKPKSPRDAVLCCEWSHLTTGDSVKIALPNPWSEYVDGGLPLR